MRKLLFLSLFLPFQIVSAANEVHEYMLDNGLKLLVKEDHRAPVVVSQVWYKVGGSYEHNGITGVSHVLEHMMFKGTTKYAPGEFSEIIAQNGGEDNAFTGRDYTAYFQKFEVSRLEVSFEMESDRMVNLTLPNDEFLKEVEVVKEERRMRTEDKPRSKTYEQFLATAFGNSPYHQPIIGWMSDLDSMTVEDLSQWYRMWYAPNNATLVVVGDVNPDEVFELAKKYFGPIPKRDVPKAKPRIEPEQIGTKRIEVRAYARVPYLMMGFKVPVLNTVEETWEPYALEVLNYVISGGTSSRFNKRLIREQKIATSADSGYDMTSMYEELFYFIGVPAEGHDVGEVETAIRAEIELLKTELVTEKELNRIKAQVIAGDVFEKDSVFYQAMVLGTFETVGLGWQRADEYVKNIKAVTAEQIQTVAIKYFTDNRLTVAVMVPDAEIDAPKPRKNKTQTSRH